MNKTIIYYTANQEKPEFEAKIIKNLKKQAGDIPIISVSRKPMNLGKNICVGEKPICYSNSFRQLLIGLKEAKTKFCLAAESDCLYPPEYFQFTPPNDQVYRYTNIYVHFDGYNGLWKKRWVEAAQMCNRKVWIKKIEDVLGDKNWKEIPVNPPFVFDTKDELAWEGMNPMLYFKTRRGIGFKTGFVQGSVKDVRYWGTVKDIKEKYVK